MKCRFSFLCCVQRTYRLESVCVCVCVCVCACAIFVLLQLHAHASLPVRKALVVLTLLAVLLGVVMRV